MELRGDIKPFKTELYGFGGTTVYLNGKITIPVTLGNRDIQKAILIKFVVVDDFKWYNAILG